MILKCLNNTKKPYLYAFLLIVIFVGSAIVTCRVKRLVFAEIDLLYTHKMLQEDFKSSVVLSKGKGCVLPRLHPFDKVIMKFEKELPAATCTGYDWVECYLEECFVARTIRDDLKDMFCVYRDIVYVNDFEHRLGPATKLNADQKYILKASDHVLVTCLGTSLQRLSPLQWSGHKTGLRRVTVNQQPCCGPRLNVLMLCFHSMSKNGFIRKMPNSYAALKTMGVLLLNGPLCSSLKLQSIGYVLLQRPEEFENKTFSYYFQAKITMSPGWSVFEVTLRYFVKSNFFAISEHDISRMNAYANESKCITNESQHIKKYCYCKN